MVEMRLQQFILVYLFFGNVACTYTPLIENDVVYVDAVQGSSKNSCGQSKSSPCQNLHTAMQNVKPSGTLVIQGRQYLEQTILLDKSICVTSSSNRHACIYSNGSVRFAFRGKNSHINVTLSNIRFRNIGILEMNAKTKQAIKNAIFKNIHATNFPGTLVILPAARKYRTGKDQEFSVKVENSWFSHCGIVIDQNYVRGLKATETGYNGHVRIVNSTFEKTHGINLFHLHTLAIDSSMFDSNAKEGKTKKHKGGAIYLDQAKIATILNSGFTRNSGEKKGGSVYISLVDRVVVKRCSFTHSSASKEGGALLIDEVKNVSITSSNFAFCLSKLGGAASFVNIIENAEVEGCTFLGNKADVGGAIYRNSQKMFLQTHKESNEGTLFIQRLQFVNNEAFSIGQAIYNKGRIKLLDTTLKSNGNISASHMHIEGDFTILKRVHVDTSSLGGVQSSLTRNGMILLSEDMRIRELDYVCPKHFNLIKQILSYFGRRKGKGQRDFFTLFSSRCESCPAKKYTLGKGSLHISRNMSNPSIVTGECLNCPTGAYCNGDIKPVDNYWGYPLSDGNLSFKQCPRGFCCSSQTTPCVSYNTCHEGRSGILCGACDEGYTLSFVSDDCIMNEGLNCNISTFLLYFFGLSFAYTAVFTFFPRITEFVKRMLDSRKKDQSNEKDVDKAIVGKKDVLQEAATESFPMSAYVTSVFLFFQIASLIHMKVQEQNMQSGSQELSSDSGFRRSVFAFFNFRILLGGKLCPMTVLTLPTKEFLNIALKLCSIGNLLIFFLIWKIFLNTPLKKMCSLPWYRNAREKADSECLQNQDKNYQEPSTAVDMLSTDHKYNTSKEERSNVHLSFVSLLKIGFVKLAKLNFTSICTFSFHMLHCVTINDTRHLYIYGDQQCYTWWQHVIMFILLPVVLLFPLSFGFALDLMNDGLISTNKFLLASVFPPYMLFLRLKKRASGLPKYDFSEAESLCINTIIEMEDMLFRKEGHFLRWSVVQLYRNLLIVVMSTFIINPVYLVLLFIPVCLMFVIHDKRAPYNHPYLNLLQMLSSASLLIISACNIPPAFSFVVNLKAIPLMSFVVLSLKYLEMMMYGLIPSSLIAWKTWDYLKKKTRVDTDFDGQNVNNATV